MTNNITGIKKLALFTRVVGYEIMVPILKDLNLSDEVYSRIDAETPDTVSKSDALAVLKEFNASALLVVGGHKENLMDAIEEIGIENGNFTVGSKKMYGFKKLMSKNAEEIFNLIQKEQPLHQAIILFELPEKLSIETFELFSVNEQSNITKEADKADSPSRETLIAINAAIEDILLNNEKKNSGNLERIYAFTDNMDEVHLNEYLENLPKDIADKIKENVLTFSIVTQQSNDVLSSVLGDIPTNEIAFAFCLSEPEVLEKIKVSLTKTKAQDVTFSIEKSVNKDDKKSILDSQRKIITRTKALHKEGKIEIIR